MIMNMLTGAHASLIPLITGLHDEAKPNGEWDVKTILSKLNSILSYESEGWVQNMSVDMIIDFLQILPDDVFIEVMNNIELSDHLPLRLCLYLMDKNSFVAEELIEKTDVLDTNDLVYRIKTGEICELIAAAKRKNLSIEVLNALIESKQPDVYLELLHNPCIQVQDDVIRHLQDVAHRSPKMAWHLVAKVADKRICA